MKKPGVESLETISDGRPAKKSHLQAFIDQEVNSDDARSVEIEALKDQSEALPPEADNQVNSSAIQLKKPEDRRGRSKSVEKRDEDLLSSNEKLNGEAIASVAVNLNNLRPKKLKK